jgi:hypothetical protein
MLGYHRVDGIAVHTVQFIITRIVENHYNMDHNSTNSDIIITRHHPRAAIWQRAMLDNKTISTVVRTD